MSLELAVISGLAIPAIVLAYIGFQLKDRHSSMKLLMVSTSLVFLLGLPFTAWQLSLEAGYTSIAEYFLGFELAIIIVFIVFVFYNVWNYIRSAALVTAGKDKAFQEDEL